MKKRVVNIIKYLFFLFIGIGLLWFITKDQDLAKMAQQFKTANYWWIVLAIILGILSHVFRSLRWNILINYAGYKTTVTTTFYAVMVGYLANLAIPRLGEVTRCGVLGKTQKIPVGLLFGTVISERTFDLITLLFLIFMTIVFQVGTLGNFLDEYILGSFGERVTGKLGTLVLLISILIAIVIFIFIAYRLLLPFIKRLKYFYKFKRLLVSFISGIKTILKNDKKWWFFFYTFIIWLLYFLMLYVCVFSLKETSGLSPIDGLTIMAIGSLGIVAPVPGGIGAYHFIVTALLVEIYHIESSAATSFAYIAHTSQITMIIVFGIISYILLVIKQKNTLTLKR